MTIQPTDLPTDQPSYEQDGREVTPPIIKIWMDIKNEAVVRGSIWGVR